MWVMGADGGCSLKWEAKSARGLANSRDPCPSVAKVA